MGYREILGQYNNYPHVVYLLKGTEDDDTLDYYFNGKILNGEIRAEQDGFIGPWGDVIPFDECVRVGTMWSIKDGTKLGDIIGWE